MRGSVWLKIISGLFAFAFGFLILLHLLVNNHASLGFLLDQLKRFSGLEVQTSHFGFNGLTGYFTGDSLKVYSSKKHFELELGEFSLRLKPAKLLIGQVEIEEINTSKLTVKLIPSETITKQAANKGRVEEIFKELLSAFYLAKADISHLDFWTRQGGHLWAGKVILEAGHPIFFSEREIKVRLSDVGFQSEKVDFFFDRLIFEGNVSRNRILAPLKFGLGIEGSLSFDEILIALPKTPSPYNADPPFEESLKPLLSKYYGDTIPDNRTYAPIQHLALPYFIDANTIKTDNIDLQAFDGKFNGHASLDNHKVDITLKTGTPFNWSLLPLGKSNLRRAYELGELDLELKGSYTALGTNNLKGTLQAVLKKSRAYPDGPDINLHLPFDMKDGMLSTNNLKVSVGDGLVKAKATLDFNHMKFGSNVTGENIDSRAVVRLFSSINIPGKANAQGTIKGDLKNPQFDLKLSSPGFGYESLFVGGFDGNLKIKDQVMKLTGTSLLENTGRGNLDLEIRSVFKSAEQSLDLKTRFENMPAGPLLNSAVLNGQVTGFYNLQKKNQTYRGSGEVHLSDALWYSLPIKKVDAILKSEDKYLHVEKTTIQWNDQTPAFTNSRRVTFHFDPEGYNFEGQLTPTATIAGSSLKANRFVDIVIDLKKSSLDMLKPLILTDDAPPVASGKIKIKYTLGQPENSEVISELSSFDFNYKGHRLVLNKPTKIGYQKQKIDFQNTSLNFGQGSMTLNGALGLIDESSLKIKGTQDIEPLVEFIPFLVEGAGLIESDIEWIGPFSKPAFKGKIVLNHDELRLRALSGQLTEVTGEILLDDERISTKGLKADFNDSPVQMDGWFEYNTEKGIHAADLHIKATEMPLNKPDNWRILADLDVTLKGSQSLTLGGQINLIEGTYFRDYSLSQFILKPVGVSYPTENEIPEWLETVNLDLGLKTSGEFLVDNNIGNIALKGDLNFKGPIKKPSIIGTVDVLDGSLQAFGLDFEDARGFINFDAQNTYVPYVDFQASQEIQNYLIKAIVRGYSDNLELSFESQPGLNKNEIISLIAFGRTPDQLNQSDRNLFSRAAIASQIVSIFQRPLSKATHLDVVKLNSTRNSNDTRISEFSIGKRLSDRVTFAFTTDLTLDQAYKGVVLEYQFLDNLLLKGSKDTGSRFRFDLTWRFEAY